MEDEFNDVPQAGSDEFETIEEFFNKKIDVPLTPQGLVTLAFSLEHTKHVLTLLLENTYMALLDVTEFVKAYPEYKDVDFTNVDEETLASIRNLMASLDKSSSEYFNSSSILLQNIINILDATTYQLRALYVAKYNKKVPNDTVKFFTILENSLESSLNIIQNVFIENR